MFGDANNFRQEILSGLRYRVFREGPRLLRGFARQMPQQIRIRQGPSESRVTVQNGGLLELSDLHQIYQKVGGWEQLSSRSKRKVGLSKHC